MVIDAVGHSGLSGGAALFKEGAGLPFPSSAPASGATAFLREVGGTRDTGFNEDDFGDAQVRAPENCGAACAPIDPCPPGADGITDITLIQKPDAPCENRTGQGPRRRHRDRRPVRLELQLRLPLGLRHLGPASDAPTGRDVVERDLHRRHQPRRGPSGERDRQRRDHQRPRRDEVRPRPDRAPGRRPDEPERPAGRPDHHTDRRRPHQLDEQPAAGAGDPGPGPVRDPGRRHPRLLPLTAGHARAPARRDRDRRRHDQVPRRVRGAGHDRHPAVSQERPGRDHDAVVGRARRARHLGRGRRGQSGRPANPVAQLHAGRPRPVRRRPRRRGPADVQLQLLQGDAAAGRPGAGDRARPDPRRRPADGPAHAGRQPARGLVQRRERGAASRRRPRTC